MLSIKGSQREPLIRFWFVLVLKRNLGLGGLSWTGCGQETGNSVTVLVFISEVGGLSRVVIGQQAASLVLEERVFPIFVVMAGFVSVLSVTQSWCNF